MPSVFEVAGTHAVPLGDAGLPKGMSQLSLDSYDTTKEDAQRSLPKLADLMTPEPDRVKTAPPEQELPGPALNDGSVPATLPNEPPNEASPKRKCKPAPTGVESPGPSLSSAPSPPPGPKRSKSPTYWRPGTIAYN